MNVHRRQYGYYFFLSDKIDAKLYAQTGSSSGTVPLLLRRHPYTRAMKARGEKEFFPLTGLSYVVLKVTPEIQENLGSRNLKSVEVEHRSRLENMLQMSNAVEMLSKAL